MLSHEKALVASGKLEDVTHARASAIWLNAESSETAPGTCNVYRPIGDKELLHLIETDQLPPTQPYQAIMEGDRGRMYAEKYLNGKKWVDTAPTTVVEFTIPKSVWDELFVIQHKVEDGCLSIGLGNKAGKGLDTFNAALLSWRIVKVKRQRKPGRRKFG